MIPKRILIVSLFAFSFVFASCTNQTDRKIKLSTRTSNQQGSNQEETTILQVEPEEQHNLAILPFKNKTTDESLDWLQRGLADMLSSELSQSIYLNIVPINLLSESIHGDDANNVKNVLASAKQYQVETVLSGLFNKVDDRLRIEVELLDVKTGEIVKSESVEGENLERIFLMVNELSDKLKTNLRIDLEASRERALKLTDMTHSVEAFKCYSEALDYKDKYLIAEAVSCLEKAINLDSTFAAAYLLLARLQYEGGNPQTIQHLVKKARDHDDKLSEPDKLFLELWEAELAGDIEKLVTSLKQLLMFEPYDSDTRRQLAGFYKQFCQYDRAIEQYEMILEQERNNKSAFNELAYLYAARGEFNYALKYLDEYERVASDEPNPYDSRGDILVRMGRFEDAVSEYKKALEKLPTFYNSSMNLAKVYSELGDLKQSLRYADQWIAAVDNDLMKAKAHRVRANILWRFGEINETKKALMKAVRYWPTSATTTILSKEFYKSIGEQKSAEKVERDFLQLFAKEKNKSNLDQYRIHNLLTWAMESDLPTEEVISVVEEYAANETRDFQKLNFQYSLGMLYLRIGEFDKAKEYLEPMDDAFISLVTQVPNRSWSQSWKYSFEAIKRSREDIKEGLEYCERFLIAAQNAKRKDLEVIAHFFKSTYYQKTGRTDELKSVYLAHGTPLEKDWRIIGPFENKSGFSRVFPPEESIDLDANYQSGNRTLHWQPADDGINDGYVDLRTALDKSGWGVAYAAVNVYSPAKRKVQLRVATDEACKLWLNDKLVWQIYRTWGEPLDHDMASVVLHSGNNKIVIKITNSMLDWGFYLRVTDENGDGLPDIKFNPIDIDSNSYASR